MGFLVLPDELTKSNYYKWILRPADRDTIHALWRKVLNKGTKHYENGILITNIKIKTLAIEAGLRYSTVKDSLARLDDLGVIIKLERKSRNNRYFVGFRTVDNQRLYLIDHLIQMYKEFLDRSIESQLKDSQESKHTPMIKDLTSYQIESDYREFIIDHCDNFNELMNKRLNKTPHPNKTIFELLFNRKDIYRKNLPQKTILRATPAP
ncbi:hypothetical protein LCGC14_1093180 [marine sediment metagenome]|uniref:Uncharacterized protein n=1 Tax=marine sediment metagenome TaxID=412755 RepID=A0A0F9QHT5_9ZZZZ